jgi:rare lipoprotein A
MNEATLIRRLTTLSLLLGAFFLAGCGRHQNARVKAPPPPEVEEAETAAVEVPRHFKPIYVETGVASWYGIPYHHRRSANGEIYDMHALTAAHRTLPLNSIARVTNLATGHSVTVRITDRGPFIDGRMLDLSFEAAKQVDVWRPGTAKVRLEVFSAPAAIDHGGRWCVQIGAFSDRDKATGFKQKLQRRYQTSNVLQFTGPTGEWIRVRVPDDEKHRAETLLSEVKAPQGTAFLVRLD